MTQALKKGLTEAKSKKISCGDNNDLDEEDYSDQEVMALLMDLYIGKHKHCMLGMIGCICNMPSETWFRT